MNSPAGRTGAAGSLPGAARARLDQLHDGDLPRTSYLSVASAAALCSVGFHAVGDVLGCATSQVRAAYVPTCAAGRGPRTGPPTGSRVRTDGSTPGGGSGYLGLVRGLYATALRRLTEEALAMGADGVVGISLTSTERDQVTEVVALGTGVRAGARPAGTRPFTTDLPGTDVAKLLLDGWAPVSLHVAAQLGVRHLDMTSARLMRAAGSRWTNAAVWAGRNAEVTAPSDLMQETKIATRTVLAGLVARAGADGCLLTSLEVTLREKECTSMPGGPGDLVSLGIATGTSVVGIGAPPRTTSTLTMMPLTTRGDIVTDPEVTLSDTALRRLAALKPGTAKGIFTSDLSVNEFLLVREAGFRPVGLVVGTSIYHVGIQLARWTKNMELDVLSQAMYHARELAMTRMEAEADALGADGIVAVRLEIDFKEFGENLAEFIAIGTAVIADEAHRSTPDGFVWRNNKQQPFTSDLSGQDFWTLLQAGYAPLGMVMGSCVYHVGHQRVLQKLANVGANIEIPQYTEALYDARERAMARMQAEAEALEAEGIVGVQLRALPHQWGGHTTEFFAIGTAVRPIRENHQMATPTLVLPLTD